MHTPLEKKVISAIQGDIPVTDRPYRALAEKAGISEQDFIQTLHDLKKSGIIRRFGATLRHQKSGYSANAMVAFRVLEERIDQLGEKLAAKKWVTHCYHRPMAEDWPYNLYTMIHAGTEDECRKMAAEMAREPGVVDHAVLFSRRELKKVSMVYFEDEEGICEEDEPVRRSKTI
jgi:DNA-binding Lrp family transcriptional regulator